jgi:polysaccharide deacetylase family protein (PEP-CTERM system associated)
MSAIPASTALLTVDVEDYFHVEAFASVIRREQWDDFVPRVERNTHRILDLFDEYGVHGTFFVLGWVAERFPTLVKEIQRRGHEIGCHSYWHRLIYGLTPQQFREDTRRAKRLLEDAAGAPVLGYRAPSFSVTRESLWALEVLVEEGFRYDASVFPIHHDNYGIPDWDPRPRWVETGGNPILEVPCSTVRLLGTNLPCAGGGYLRLLPLSYNLLAIRRIRRAPGRHPMIYLHPWELDSEQPRIAAGRLSRLRHYTGLRRTEGRLRRILDEFPVAPVAGLLESVQPC